MKSVLSISSGDTIDLLHKRREATRSEKSLFRKTILPSLKIMSARSLILMKLLPSASDNIAWVETTTCSPESTASQTLCLLHRSTLSLPKDSLVRTAGIWEAIVLCFCSQRATDGAKNQMSWRTSQTPVYAWQHSLPFMRTADLSQRTHGVTLFELESASDELLGSTFPHLRFSTSDIHLLCIRRQAASFRSLLRAGTMMFLCIPASIISN